MGTVTDITSQFLLAAKRSELKALTQLSANCHVVAAISSLIHQLQRERGLSNIYLASDGQRFVSQRYDQVDRSQVSEARLQRCFKAHFLDDAHVVGRTRLLNAIAHALYGFEQLPTLRGQIERRQVSAIEATKAFSQLIASLLAIVFEAADIAGEPKLTRALVAIFNFVQGKEYAGQERAWGAIGFAKGRFDLEILSQLSVLQSSQQGCFGVFTEFAERSYAEQLSELEVERTTQDLNRLRSIVASFSPGGTINAELSETWYELTTQRIDRLKLIEEQLCDGLLALCEAQIDKAEQSLQRHRNRLHSLKLDEPVTPPLNSVLFAQTQLTAELSLHDGAGRCSAPELANSVLELVQCQAERLKRMGVELHDARTALHERKRIERAKGLLMQKLGLSEAQAHKALQQRAMDGNLKLADVAESVLVSSSDLPLS